jgi:carbonic anhydrase/acetyltransferase-like protein (isoleucine patch superfamily)
VKTGQIWAGAPAKLLRTVSAEEASFLVQSADNYAKLAQAHKWVHALMTLGALMMLR